MSGLKISSQLSLPLDVVTEALGIVATRGAGKSYASAVLIEEAYAAGVQTVVLDPAGVYHGLRSSSDGQAAGLPIYVFGGPHGDLPLEPHAGAFIADLVVDSGHSFVLDLSDLPSKAATRRFVAEFLERLYTRKARNRSNLMLVVDEADEFAPQVQRGRSAPESLGAMETITKRGRSRGVGVVLITQRTQALNKDVLDLIETLIAMRQLAKRSRDAVEGWIADKDLRDEHGVIESLQSLPTGTAWVWSPLRALLKQVEFRRINTFDSYQTPKPGEKRIEAAARAELDLAELGEQMRDTVERAKAADPAELRRRISDLERQLAAKAAEPQVKVEEVERIVEVAVLTDGERDLLDHARKAIEGLGEQLANVADVLTPKLDAISARGANLAEVSPPRQAARAVVSPSAGQSEEPGGRRKAQGERQPTGATSSNGLSRRAERAVLSVLAQYPEGRTKRQAAILAGYAVKGGGFAGALSKLRTLGYMEGSDSLRITDAGRRAIEGQWEPLPTGRALLDHHLSSMKRAAERAVLQVIYDAYPEALPKDVVAERAGYEVTGGGFAGALSKLRTLELIEGSGELRATDALFE